MPDQPAAASAETVEHLVRSKLAEALGGRRGVVESAVPTLAFTLLFIPTHDLRLALTVSIAITVGLLIVRVIQRSTVQFVLNALVGIGIAALFAIRAAGKEGATAEEIGRAFFTPGLIYNAGYAVVIMLTILVGWPIVGFMVGGVTGDPTGWHQDRALVKLCSRLTWLLVLPCLIRLAVQFPLWLNYEVGLLATSKIILGWPLQIAAFAAMAWLLSRNKTPVNPSAQASG
jgi:hypothetical protein